MKKELFKIIKESLNGEHAGIKLLIFHMVFGFIGGAGLVIYLTL